MRWFQGQIFPFACRIAAPSAVFAVGAKLLEREAALGDFGGLSGSMFAAFSTLVSFVVVFRTSQAHQRFSSGVNFIYMMLGDWTDAASSLIAFSVNASELDAQVFRHSIVRLISLLNALMLAELSVDDERLVAGRLQNLELLDLDGLDDASLDTLKTTANKTEVVFHWLQCYIVQNIPTGLQGVPPPILSRAFQMLGAGVEHYHQCKQLAQVPWPFPYTQTTEALLIIHWIVTPVCMAKMSDSLFWACAFTFIQVFVCWALNGIAIELENPFDEGQDDMDLAQVQRSLNSTLLIILQPSTNAPPKGCLCKHFVGTDERRRSSLLDLIGQDIKGISSMITQSGTGLGVLYGSERSELTQKESRGESPGLGVLYEPQPETSTSLASALQAPRPPAPIDFEASAACEGFIFPSAASFSDAPEAFPKLPPPQPCTEGARERLSQVLSMPRPLEIVVAGVFPSRDRSPAAFDGRAAKRPGVDVEIAPRRSCAVTSDQIARGAHLPDRSS